MLITISPAKSLDFDSPNRTTTHTIPDFLKDSRDLNKSLRKFSAGKLSKLMSISEKLGELNHTRNQQWKTPFTLDNARQAILAFQGDVYVGLEAETFKAADFRLVERYSDPIGPFVARSRA
ncbi:MAG: peroxide stress protein YaaA [Planctomycetes bacterium]|nr:peroxide stress protein YaaA [Planctomycetota bacterium]